MSENNGQANNKQESQGLPNQNAPAIKPPITTEKTVEQVLQKISDFQTAGELKLPPNYSPENAVRSAWLIIQDVKDLSKKPALEVCSRESVATALLDMVMQGLSPVKKQCYFIVYGNKLTCMKSYIGTVAISKRVANVKEPIANVVYEKDEFHYEIDIQSGRKKIVKHVQKMENIDITKIKGAYCIVTFNDASTDAEIMTLDQIKKAWLQGAAKGTSGAHNNFTDEMCKKTVIQRALKLRIGSSDDSALYDEEEFETDAHSANVRQTVKDNGNKQDIKIDEEEIQNAEVVNSGVESNPTETQVSPEDKCPI